MMLGEQRSLRLDKGRHQYIFSYHSGQESELLSAFVELAEDDDCDFNWLDAAVLSFQIDLCSEAETLVQGPATTRSFG